MRVRSIDVFRALTMLLMIFVNDLWTLKDVPEWLDHAPWNKDFLGLADIVFPAFLFVLGMSIPYAIASRVKKGQKPLQILSHIAIRSLALLIMGVYTAAQPMIVPEASKITQYGFAVLMVIAFFLIWNVYPKDGKLKRNHIYMLQALGVVILVVIAILFKGKGWGSDEIKGFGIFWWGILGIIGWTYLACATFFYIIRKYAMPAVIIGLVVVCGINIQNKLTGIEWFIGGGAFHAFTLFGILASLIFEKLRNSNKLYIYFLAIGALLIAAGIFSRQYFMISKLLATPTWVFLCTGISFAFFALIHFIIEKLNGSNAFNIINPAGSATLTCYMIPYVWDSVLEFINFKMPEVLVTGNIGLIKNALYALAVVILTGFLSRIHLKLKI